MTLRSRETHSARLLPGIEEVLSSAGVTLREIDLFGVTIGPGSFTGLRVGLATAKGFAWAHQKPLVGVSSLEVLVQHARASAGPSDTFVPMLDARKGRVYGAAYQWRNNQLVCLLPPADVDAAHLLQQVASTATQAPGRMICFGVLPVKGVRPVSIW